MVGAKPVVTRASPRASQVVPGGPPAHGRQTDRGATWVHHYVTSYEPYMAEPCLPSATTLRCLLTVDENERPAGLQHGRRSPGPGQAGSGGEGNGDENRRNDGWNTGPPLCWLTHTSNQSRLPLQVGLTLVPLTVAQIGDAPHAAMQWSSYLGFYKNSRAGDTWGLGHVVPTV